MVGKRKYFYFIPQMRIYTYRNWSSCKVIQNQWKQWGTETLLSRIPNCAWKTIHFWPWNHTPVFSVCLPRVAAGAVPPVQFCFWALQGSQQLCPAWGRQTFTGELLPWLWLGPGEVCIKIFSWLANLKEKDIFWEGGGGCCLLNIVSFLLLTQPIANL